jgi:protein-tyrosine phosphatase
MSGNNARIRVLFVCTGNICRSPTAEGVFRAMVEATGLAGAVEVDSAGTTDFHSGEPPDARARMAALGRGIDLGGQRARRICADDFERFDFVVAMDRTHRRELLRLCPKSLAGRVRLFMESAPQCATLDVPDPYYSGLGGFDYVLDLIEAGAAGLLQDVRTALNAAE